MSRRKLNVDVAVVGAGSGGLSVASGCAQLGLKVVLFERGEMGGDCLNTGCVPSKTLLAVGKRAHAFRSSAGLGIAAAEPSIDWAQVKAHVRRVIATIAPIDSQERFEGLGATVIREHARFTGARTLESESVTVNASRIVIATGGAAAVPPIPGLAETPYLTNETVFDVEPFPQRLIVLGGGPIGMELGQAFRRLGAAVTVIEAAQPLGSIDPEAAAEVLTALRDEGVDIRAQTKAVAVSGVSGDIRVEVEGPSGRETVSGTHLLVAVGRKPVMEGLDLEKGGVAFGKRGIDVDDSLRSKSNRRVWAVGDVAGREQLTHVAGAHASVFVRGALFKAPAKAPTLIPAAVYTDPETAQVGLSETAAREKYGDRQKAVTVHFHDNDRAQAEGDPRGFLKVIVGPGAKILGAVCVGEGAADVLQIIVYAMARGENLQSLTSYIAPYPTRAEIVKRAASLYYTPIVFGPMARALVSIAKHLP